MTPNEHDRIAAHFLDSLGTLSLQEQAAAIHALINDALKRVPLSAIYEMREAITDQFAPTIPIVRSTLELIDGQLALREIAGDECWR